MSAPKGVITARGKYPRHLISTGFFIRDHLIEVIADYPMHMWKLLKEEKAKQGIKTGTYQNFRNYVYWLAKLGLIKFIREQPSENPFLKPRRYYAYVTENLDKLELWKNPRRALYPESWLKHH